MKLEHGIGKKIREDKKIFFRFLFPECAIAAWENSNKHITAVCVCVSFHA